MAIRGDGAILVADAGAPAEPTSGRVVEIGSHGTVMSLLGDIANATGSDAESGQAHLHGLSDLAVDGNALYIVLGEEAWVGSPLLGPNRLIRRDSSGDVAPIFDIGFFEQEYDPDRAGPESNGTGVAVTPDGMFWVTDAAGNWAAYLAADGTVEATVTFPNVDGEDAVPTGVAVGPDGSAYVALFHCRSPTAGKGGVARVAANGRSEIVVANLNLPIDVAFDQSGNMYVLEFAVDYAPRSGRVLRVPGQDPPVILIDGLNFPTSLAIDAAGRFYVTEIVSPAGGKAGTGRLLRFDPTG